MQRTINHTETVRLSKLLLSLKQPLHGIARLIFSDTYNGEMGIKSC